MPDALDAHVEARLMSNPKLGAMLCELVGEDHPAADNPAGEEAAV